MNYNLLSNNIKKHISLHDSSSFIDFFSMCLDWEKENFELAHSENKWLREMVMLELETCNPKDIDLIYSVYRKSLLFDAKHDFDAYMQYVELDRPISKKFYLPRRHYLKDVVKGYQDILDGKIRLLTVSMPKRSGKSQVEINFACMMSGKNPNGSSLIEGTGDALVNSFHNGCLEYLQTPNEYLFYDIFPNSKIVQTKADMKIINLDQKSRFPTIMCRSIDSSQVGLSEATNVLMLDDCVDGREEGKNRFRLDTKWETISGDILGRAIEGTPVVFSGTRYSMYDPIGKMQNFAEENNWKWRSIETPALDFDTDESNYEYVREGKKVFTTSYFKEQRELLSEEQFESEFQQQPFEAKGLLFPKKELKTYMKLPPDISPDAIIAACDTAHDGDDSLCLVIGAIYEQDVFIIDVVFDNSESKYTKPQCAKKLVEHNVVQVTFESNNAGDYYGNDVVTLVQGQGGKINAKYKRSISNKQTRIEFASDGIKKNFYFKHHSLYEKNSQYYNYIDELTHHTRSGKVLHDDAPDATAMLENEVRFIHYGKVETIKRPC
jgi:predicted phage terminase large subunit-like protein